MTGGIGRRRGARLLLLLLIGTVLVAAAGFWAGTVVHSSQQIVPRHIREPAPSVAIQRRVLADRLQASGTIIFAIKEAISPLPPSLAGDAVPLVTRMPLHVGATVRVGNTVAEIAGQPVFALVGAVPMYRSLSFGMYGDDVAQLQHNLDALGYAIDDAPGHYGSSTADAVAKLFEREGYLAPTTRVVIGTSSAHGKKEPVVERFAMLPEGDAVFLKVLPATAIAVNAREGARIEGALGTLASGPPLVRMRISTTQLATLRRGMVTTITWGEHRGRARLAKLPGINPNGASSEIVTAYFIGRTHPPVGKEVTASITRASSRRPVWVVPYSAVGTAANGSNFVILVGTSHRRVPVRLGLSAGGYVAIRSPALTLSVHDTVLVNA